MPVHSSIWLLDFLQSHEAFVVSPVLLTVDLDGLAASGTSDAAPKCLYKKTM